MLPNAQSHMPATLSCYCLLYKTWRPLAPQYLTLPRLPQRLQDTGLQTLAAIDAKDAVALFDLGGTIDDVRQLPGPAHGPRDAEIPALGVDVLRRAAIRAAKRLPELGIAACGAHQHIM